MTYREGIKRMVHSRSSEFLLRRPEQPSYRATENKQEALERRGVDRHVGFGDESDDRDDAPGPSASGIVGSGPGLRLLCGRTERAKNGLSRLEDKINSLTRPVMVGGENSPGRRRVAPDIGDKQSIREASHG
jgi:hypothetical protein